MASIGTLFPTAATTASSASTTNSQTSSTTSASASNSLANTNTFLQLLVAQLKNQDPTTPMDGTTFVTQLAQFSDLQANVGSEQDLNAISQSYLGTVPSATSAGTGTTSSVSGS
jgi:flagellar basal-body rod modification protein FlgD